MVLHNYWVNIVMDESFSDFVVGVRKSRSYVKKHKT